MTNEGGASSGLSTGCQQRPRQRDDGVLAAAIAIVCEDILFTPITDLWRGRARALRCVANRWPDEFGEKEESSFLVSSSKGSQYGPDGWAYSGTQFGRIRGGVPVGNPV